MSLLYIHIEMFYSFSVYTSFASWLKFTPNYFIILDAIVNEIVFLISFSDCSLLGHRNTTDFCMLIFYSVTLIHLLTLILSCECV